MVQNKEFVVFQEEKVEEVEMIFCRPEEGEHLDDYEPSLVQEVDVVLKEMLTPTIEEEELTLALGEKEEVVYIGDKTKEEQRLLSSTIIPFEYAPKEFALVLSKKPQLELNCDEYICVFNKLMSNGVSGHDFQNKTAPMNFKNTYVFKKNGVLSTMVVLQVNGCIHVIWLMFLGDSEFDHKDFRANPF